MYFGYNYQGIIKVDAFLEDFHEYPLPTNLSLQLIIKLDLSSTSIKLNTENKIMINLHKIGNPWKKGLEIWRISKYFKNIDMYTLVQLFWNLYKVCFGG